MTTEPYRLAFDEDISISSLAHPDGRAPEIPGDQLSANYSAAERGADAILAKDEWRDSRDDRERTQDLLTDIAHLCDLVGLDFDDLVESARTHHAAEIRGEL